MTKREGRRSEGVDVALLGGSSSDGSQSAQISSDFFGKKCIKIF
jgi:hypothetical protein